MERVTFILEDSNTQISCMLNPEFLEFQREAGVRARRAGGARLTGEGLADDPMLVTGGGATTFELALLFDSTLGSRERPATQGPPGGAPLQTPPPRDVRELTRPFWELAETSKRGGEPPTVRFVWGKAWSLSVVVSAVAERFDRFSADGTPLRSWMRMRLYRRDPAREETSAKEPEAALLGSDLERAVEDIDDVDYIRLPSTGGPSAPARLDQLAAETCGDPGQWRLLALLNELDDPGDLPAGAVLEVPAGTIGRST